MKKLKDQFNLIVNADHWDPFAVLGPHPQKSASKESLIIRAFLPDAEEASVIPPDQPGLSIMNMKRIHPEGIFEAEFKDAKEVFPYMIEIKTRGGETRAFHDPYSFPAILTDFDLHLFNEGTHFEIYEKFGAHTKIINGVKGVSFAVWAPNAGSICVTGDFNNWDGRRHPMRGRGVSGVWELFIPGITTGEKYKFRVKSKRGDYIEHKADPYAFYFEERPRSASIVHNINRYKWNDDEWISERTKKNWLDTPISTYEVHLGSWRRHTEENNRFLTYRELAASLIPYVKDMGYTHIELLPVMEHPLDESWGYQVIGYFAPTSRFGTPEDFMYFVDQCHLNGIGVILDWVPAHFPKDPHGLASFDGTSLYEHEDPRKREQMDWGTLIFNYGRNEVSNFLISNALFWLKKYHIDGLRVDAVASMIYLDYSRGPGEWIPNIYGGNENLEAIAFIKRFNEVVHQYNPGVLTIAEESTAWPMVSKPTYVGGLGFSLKWDLGWMHDILSYIVKDPLFRKFHHNELTFRILYAFTENFVLVLSHDEVVHGKGSMLDKMSGDLWQRFANLRLLYGLMYGQPGKKLLFMGGEIGQWREWAVSQSLDWHLLQYEPHKKLQRYIKDMNQLYKNETALYEADFDHRGFEWIDFRDWEHSIISFIRRGKNRDDLLVLIFNFTPVPHSGYRLGVPENGFYREIINSDSDIYWGSNMGNSGGLQAEKKNCHGMPYSVNLVIPPLSVIILKPQHS
ncbi:MAG: 1,4-alpha-glucan branching protein GlgB [Nitrospirae bacterium]|nr:1,4-alpha-glucan branching protein GlgB [Nitrospirota bacterium]